MIKETIGSGQQRDQGKARLLQYPDELVKYLKKIILFGEENGDILIYYILNTVQKLY